MAELVSPIADIISRLWPCCATHTRYLCELQENKTLLRNAMDELKEKRDEVQRRVIEAEADPNEPKKRDESVSGWLQRVDTIENEVEEILEIKDEQLSRGRCLGGCCPPNKCWKNYKLGKSVVKKMASVDKLKESGHFQVVAYKLPPPSVQELNLEPTVGMEFMFEKVWKLITEKNVRIMGLYGQGGVGKTTLLEKINNEFKKSKNDHVVIFVVVSKPINYEAIQNKIGERLGLSDSFKEDKDESSRSHKIYNILNNKSFVILLDDIWEGVDLKRIGIPIAGCNSSSAECNSSKVIFTTRKIEECRNDMDVTHTFLVECLPWHKAWMLFQNKVGVKTVASFPNDVLELAKLVAKECGGLPLALITIGRAMSNKKTLQEWKNAKTTLEKAPAKFQGMTEKVLSRLKLSYDYLDDETTIKSCFLYCALFPEDYSIGITRLIEYWIGEGFLNGFENLDDARNHGRDVIETLKRACLFEGDEDEVKMHDIIRDLALWIVNDCNKTSDKFLVASTKNVLGKELSGQWTRWKSAQRIFWANYDKTMENELEEPPDSPNLETLIVANNDLLRFSLPRNIFQYMTFLRVLDFSNSELEELPTSICQLSELQYLDLSNTSIKELPVELRKLVKLKFLNLDRTLDLRKIPAGMIATFSELQILALRDAVLNEEDGCNGLSFQELNSLKQLEDLRITINTSVALEKLLLRNQKLRMICTALNLQNCVNLKSVSLLPCEGVGNLTSLKYLEIYCLSELEELILFINMNDSEETNVTTTTTSGGTGLLTNNKLEDLRLIHLPRLNNIVLGEKYHHHLHEYSPFQNLYRIRIESCRTLKDLTWLVYMENLRELYVKHCGGLETIIELDDDGLEGARGGDQMLNLGGRVFGRLNVLVLFWLPKLKSICRHALAFPSIETIDIFNCQELKKLPLDSDSNINNTLEEIKVSKALWNGLEWEDETIKSKFLPYYRGI